MTDKLLDALCLVEEYADNFVTHWMEDDGNDADDKARCEQTSEDIAKAGTEIAKALAAARTMLAALKLLTDTVEKAWPALAHLGPLKQARAAIAQAEAAGITAEEKS